jgi:hypothetical protein
LADLPNPRLGIGVAANAWDVFVRKPITDSEIVREEQRLREKHVAL